MRFNGNSVSLSFKGLPNTTEVIGFSPRVIHTSSCVNILAAERIGAGCGGGEAARGAMRRRSTSVRRQTVNLDAVSGVSGSQSSMLLHEPGPGFLRVTRLSGLMPSAGLCRVVPANRGAC